VNNGRRRQVRHAVEGAGPVAHARINVSMPSLIMPAIRAAKASSSRPSYPVGDTAHLPS
jgi:hypothetical protein